MTIDELIMALNKAKEISHLGGQTVVCLSIPGYEYIPITDTYTDQTDNEEDGSIFLLHISGESIKMIKEI